MIFPVNGRPPQGVAPRRGDMNKFDEVVLWGMF